MVNYPNDFWLTWGTSVWNRSSFNIPETVVEDIDRKFTAQFGLTLSTSVRVALIGKIEAQVNAAAGMERITHRGDSITVTTAPRTETKVDRGVIREKVRMRIVDWYSNCTHRASELDVNAAERTQWRAYLA